jgi:hypothetical protein
LTAARGLAIGLVLASATSAFAQAPAPPSPRPPPALLARPSQGPSAGAPQPHQSPDDDDGTSSEGSTAALEALLIRLRAESLPVRRAALDQLLQLDASDVGAIRARLLAPLGNSPLTVHAAMVSAIREATGGREGAEADLLDALMNASRRTPDTVIATERVALARAIGRIPSADAGRALLAFGMEHNRIFRLETLRIARNIAREYMVPAVIEYRRPTDDARLFIRNVREAIHRVTPGDSVQTHDNALLSEILRAFGATHQQDALNVVVSFVNSDRAQVRDAARWAISQYGRDAINALRTAYENYVGEDANPQWGWERVSRELYEAYDRRRADEVSAALDEGLAASRNGEDERMLERFQFVLARHPLYDRRSEMVGPLMAYAQRLEARDANRAEWIYRLALRIGPEAPTARRAQSAIQFLEAERALARGVADPELYRLAVRTDPANRRAQAQLDAVVQVEVVKAKQRRRALVAIGLFAMALAGLGLLLNRLRQSAGKEPGGGQGGSGGGGSSGSSSPPGQGTPEPQSAA